MTEQPNYQQGAFVLRSPEPHTPATDAMPMEAMTPREAAKALIRPYALRGDPVDELKRSLMGSANEAFHAQIGGSVARDGERRKVRSDQIGVSRVGTEPVGAVFSLSSLYKEIRAEAEGEAHASGGSGIIDETPVTPEEEMAATPALAPTVVRIDDDLDVLPNRRLPHDFWPEYRREWAFREEHDLPSVSPAEFRDLRDRADGVLAPQGGSWRLEPERPAYPEWEPVSDMAEMGEGGAEEAEDATLPDAPRDNRFLPEGTTVFDARRERLDATIDVLAAKVEQLVTGDGYRDYLRMLAKFHTYSANNVALILAQYPDATNVMGYGNKQGTTGWKSLGRNVRQGEKGIRIIRPVHETIAADDATGEATRVLRGFATATVFDIRQTEGKPLPHEPRPQELPQDEAMRSLELKVKLLAFLDERQVRVVRDHHNTQKGYWNPARREIGIRADLSGVRELKTLIHEAGHFLADHRREQIDMADAETVAESLAFVVLDHEGIDTSAYSARSVRG